MARIVRELEELRAHVAALEGEARRRGVAEAALQRSERTYRALVETTGTGYVILDMDGRVVDANPEYVRLTGHERLEEIRGRCVTEWTAEVDRERNAEAVRRCVADGVVRNLDMRYADAAGRITCIEINATVVEGEGGRQIVTLCRDVTARRQQEAALREAGQALRESEQRMRAIFENAGVGIMEVDFDQRIISVNEAMCAALAADREQIVGRTIHDLTYPDDRRQSDELNARLRDGGLSGFEVDKRYVRGDGSPVWMHVTVSAIRDAAGRPVRFIGVCLDVSARKQAEAERERLVAALREADRRKDDFLAVLSHELRNPLTPIVGGLDLLRRAAPGGAQAQRLQQVIERQVKQLERLVDDLLDVTRIARGKVRLHHERVDVNELVRATLEDHRALFERSQIALEVTLAPEPAFASADPARLSQVVGNLLVNAAKFTVAGGSTDVAVTVDRDAGRVTVRVADSGVGIPPEVLARLFEPFVQADVSLDRGRGGLGLGLALVKGLVELHDGTVTARSAGSGQGAEFLVTLPLVDRPAAVVAPPTAAPAPPRRVLVIEDNVDAADTLRDMLECGGHEVEVVANGHAGLARARASRPDVVLCDLGLPGLNGYEVARAIRADGALAGTRLVAVSGYALPEDVQRAVDAGFEQHLAKPFSLQRLEAALAASAERGDPAIAPRPPRP